MNRLERLLRRTDHLVQRGQLGRAADLLEETLATHPLGDKGCEIISAYLGDIYLSLHELDRAEANLKHAIEHNSAAAEYHYLLGIIYSAGMRWPEAINTLWRALELLPEDDEYLRAVGWAVFNSGDEKQGRALLQEALQVNRSNMVTLTDLALVYTRAFQFQDALHCARRAVELDPLSDLAQDVLRVVQRFKHEYERLARQGKFTSQGIEA